ncbi:uncharacterized protein LOC124265000 [Haliotis rubra]|uniref:uncharacterized protein LOC124265000 n=1 Tax=Haliotis rubra TaxID=36100 RepID=UPI001EE52101|nr:uncharacterized protein LOC124265000 [Haliotis rubra]
MWTNIHGSNIPQNQWRPIHFVTMMPFAPRTESAVVEEDSTSVLGDTVAFDDSADALKGDLDISSLLSNLECDTMAFEDSAFEDSADTLKDLNITSLLSNLDCDTMEVGDSSISDNRIHKPKANSKFQNPEVVENPDQQECSSLGAWVQFYEEKRLWSLKEKKLFVCYEDIVGLISQPKLFMLGSRVYYDF